MAEKTYRVKGKVVDKKTKKGIPRLKVEALIFNDLVGSRVTAEDGVKKGQSLMMPRPHPETMKKNAHRLHRLHKFFYIFFIICVNLCNLWAFFMVGKKR